MKKLDDFRLKLDNEEFVPIMLGGMGTVVPERRDEIVAMGLKSIVSGTLATCMTGAVVGIMFSF